MSTSLLFTNRFPFPTGEEYLQTEIPFLAEQFDELIICPTMPGTTENHDRSLPANVTVLRPAIQHGMKMRLKLLARGVSSPRSTVEGAKFYQKMFDRYFHARTTYVADQIEPILRKIIQDRGTDVSVIYAYWFYITASVAIELRNRIPELSGVKIVARGHGYDVNEAASPINYLPSRRRMLDAVESLHPTAETITKRMRDEWPQFAHKISTRRLGVSVAQETSNRSITGPISVLSCSSLSPLKRIPLMAEAIAHLKSQGHAVEWTHIGSGSDKQMAELNAVIKDLQIENEANLIGQVSNREVYEMLTNPKFQVFLNTSSSESVSFSMSEALGAGLPVVATDVVGTHEIIETGRNGVLLVSNPTPQEVASGILRVVNQTESDYLTMQHRAIATCKQFFHPETVYGEFASSLARLGNEGRQ